MGNAQRGGRGMDRGAGCWVCVGWGGGGYIHTSGATRTTFSCHAKQAQLAHQYCGQALMSPPPPPPPGGTCPRALTVLCTRPHTPRVPLISSLWCSAPVVGHKRLWTATLPFVCLVIMAHCAEVHSVHCCGPNKGGWGGEVGGKRGGCTKQHPPVRHSVGLRFFTGPWTVTRSYLRMQHLVAVF